MDLENFLFPPQFLNLVSISVDQIPTPLPVCESVNRLFPHHRALRAATQMLIPLLFPVTTPP